LLMRIRLLSKELHPELIQHRHDRCFIHKAFMTIDFASVSIVKDLRRNGPNAEFRPLLPKLPDIDEDDGGFTVVFFFELFHDGDRAW